MKTPMIENIKDLVAQAVLKLGSKDPQKWNIEKPQQATHGDYSTNAAMVL